MHIARLSSALLALAIFGGPPVLAAPHQQAHPTSAPLVVGGTTISSGEIRRFAIYGPGRAVLGFEETQYLIERELDGRTAHARASVDVTPSEFAEALAARRADFELRYPTLDYVTEVNRVHRSRDFYERQLRQELLFDKVFLPEDPALWSTQVQAALREEAGDILIDDATQSFERRRSALEAQLAAWGGTGPKPRIPPEDRMYRSILRSIVRDALLTESAACTASVRQRPWLLSELRSEVLGGRSGFLRTADVWQDLEPSITPEEMMQARRLLATLEATRQRLASEGELLDHDVAQARHAERRLRRDEQRKGWNSPPSMPFPEAEGAYIQISESFRERARKRGDLEAGGRLSPALQQHLGFANAAMGLARVEAEVLPITAFDLDRFEWKAGGWSEALARADELATKLARSNVDWDEALVEFGEYWNPPPPAVGRPCWNSPSPLYSGAARSRGFADLRKSLEESPYTEFLQGRSLSKTIFFDVPVGEVGGPFEGTHGYYLVKVLERQPCRRPLHLDDEFHVELLRDSWLRNALLEYSREALEMVGLPGVLEHSAVTPNRGGQPAVLAGCRSRHDS